MKNVEQAQLLLYYPSRKTNPNPNCNPNGP